jgi:ATP-dependent Zn protease
MRSPTLLQTAWHEAGHAVVAWDRGFTVTLVSIRRIGDSYGRCQHAPAGDCAVPSERERENIVAMAGWAAELASGEANGDTYDSSDLSWVLIQLEQHAPPSQIRIELGWAEQEADRIVRENIERVERLAGVLMERTELTDLDEIRAIIES